MKKKLLNIIYSLTGGRPMKYIGFNFRDLVSGESVNDYHDKFGRRWMATSKWSLFRVRSNRGDA